MWTDFLKVQDNAQITPFASLFNIEICRVNKNNSMNQISKFGIFALLLSSSLTIMVGTVIAPSLKEISVHLGFEENPGLLITLPSLGVVIFAPFVGKLIDRKGAYLMLRWGLIPYALLGLLGGLLTNPYLVVIDRILLGVATASIQAAGTGLIALLFIGDDRLKMIAWQGMSIELGGVVFLSFGGLLGGFCWKYPFLIYLMGLVCALLISISVKRSADAVRKKVVAVESTERTKISRHLLIIILSAAFAMMLFFVAFVCLPLFLPSSFHYSEAETGYFMAFISIVAVIAASQMPRVTRYLSKDFTLSMGFFAFAIGLTIFFITTSNITLFIGAVAMGIGFGFTVPLLNHMTVEESSSSNLGQYLSYYSMAIFGGQFLSSFITELNYEMRTTFLIAAVLACAISVALYIIASINRIHVFNNNL